MIITSVAVTYVVMSWNHSIETSQLADVVVEKDKKISALSSRITGLMAENNSTKKDLEKAVEKLANVTESNEELTAYNKILSQNFDVLGNELSELESRYRILLNNHEYMETNYTELEKRYFQILSENEDLTKTVNNQATNIRSLKRTINRLDGNLDDLKPKPFSVTITNPGDNKYITEDSHWVSGYYSGNADPNANYRVTIAVDGGTTAWDQGPIKPIAGSDLFESSQPAFGLTADPDPNKDKKYVIMVVKVSEVKSSYENYQDLSGFKILDSVTIVRYTP